MVGHTSGLPSTTDAARLVCFENRPRPQVIDHGGLGGVRNFRGGATTGGKPAQLRSENARLAKFGLPLTIVNTLGDPAHVGAQLCRREPVGETTDRVVTALSYLAIAPN